MKRFMFVLLMVVAFCLIPNLAHAQTYEWQYTLFCGAGDSVSGLYVPPGWDCAYTSYTGATWTPYFNVPQDFLVYYFWSVGWWRDDGDGQEYQFGPEIQVVVNPGGSCVANGVDVRIMTGHYWYEEEPDAVSMTMQIYKGGTAHTANDWIGGAGINYGWYGQGSTFTEVDSSCVTIVFDYEEF